jgi:hypothetical protein
MMPQMNANEPLDERANSTYGRYEGDQEHVRQREEIPYNQPLREGMGEKVYVLPRDNTNLFRLLVFVIAMVTLLMFVVVCLVFVGGTAGWISFTPVPGVLQDAPASSAPALATAAALTATPQSF